MALLLKEKDVEQLLTMPLAIDLVERVHREYSAGNAIDVPRERTRLPKAALHILQGAVPSAGVFGMASAACEPAAENRDSDRTTTARTPVRTASRTPLARGMADLLTIYRRWL